MWSKMVGGFLLKFILFVYQSEEEASSAGEQLVSNKVDAYTIRRWLSYWEPFLCLSASYMAKKTHFALDKCTYH